MAKQPREVEDRPRRRKRRPDLEGRSKKKERPGWFWPAVIGGSLAGLLLLVVVVLTLVKVAGQLGGEKVTAPTSFLIYSSPEQVFGCEYPEGWRLEDGGKKGYVAATFTKGDASIRISESLVGSLKGDIANAATPDLNVPDERLPVSIVHESKRDLYAEEYPNYQEEPAETVMTRFGKVRRSAFTSSQMFGAKIRGYRATALGPMTQIEVVCKCPASDWELLEPAFARAISTLGPGTGVTGEPADQKPAEQKKERPRAKEKGKARAGGARKD